MININLVKSNFINSLKSKMSQDEIKSIWDTWVLCEILNLTKIQCIIDQNIDINSYNVSKINDLISHLLANNPNLAASLCLEHIFFLEPSLSVVSISLRSVKFWLVVLALSILNGNYFSQFLLYLV